jgi:Holliday junction resolvase
MHKPICFEIPGPIKGKARPRMTRTGMVYTPKDTVNYENLIKICYKEAVDAQLFDNLYNEPIKVNIKVYYEIPKSTTKKKKALMLLDKLYPTKKPDNDNIAKVILDSLNGIAYKDDAQVVELIINKFFTKNEKPYVVVTLEKC